MLDAARLEQVLIGVGQQDLAGRSSGLGIFEAPLVARQPEVRPAQRDGAGRHDQHLLAARLQAGQFVGNGLEPGAIELARGRSTSSEEPILRRSSRRAAPLQDGAVPVADMAPASGRGGSAPVRPGLIASGPLRTTPRMSA